MLKKLFNRYIDAFNEIKTISFDWDKFTPKRKWETLYKVGDVTGRLIGLNILTDTKLSGHWFLLLIVIVLYYSLAAYTIVYYGIKGQFSEGITCLSLAGLYTQVSFYLI